jgi:hypothetical protein
LNIAKGKKIVAQENITIGMEKNVFLTQLLCRRYLLVQQIASNMMKYADFSNKKSSCCSGMLHYGISDEKAELFAENFE